MPWMKLLPLGKYLGIALALFAAYKYIANNVETRINLERAKQAEMLVKLKDDLEKSMADQVSAIDTRTGETIRQIETVRSTVVKPTIEREIVREVRLSDPAVGITDGLLAALNRSRQLSHSGGAAGSITVALPAAVPAD